jgi:predicted nucleotidyltransferase
MPMNSPTPSEVETILSLNSIWFQSRDDVLGIALVGSYARKAAQPSSDIDLVILSTTPQAYRDDVTWPSQLPWNALGVSVKSWRDEDYGLLWSRHVLLSSDLEIEYGFASTGWASIPIDAVTYQVMKAGHRVLYDPQGLLAAMSEYVRTHGTE